MTNTIVFPLINELHLSKRKPLPWHQKLHEEIPAISVALPPLAEVYGKDKAPGLREETHPQSSNPWPECDTVNSRSSLTPGGWAGKDSTETGNVMKRAHTHCKVRSATEPEDELSSMEYSDKEAQEGQTFIWITVQSQQPRKEMKGIC